MTDREDDAYGVWLRKYSAGKDPVEALQAVQKEVEILLRAMPPPLEVRVAALESFVSVWTDFLVSILFIDGLRALDPDIVIERTTISVEFLRLAALSEAIQLDRLANRKEEDESGDSV